LIRNESLRKSFKSYQPSRIKSKIIIKRKNEMNKISLISSSDNSERSLSKDLLKESPILFSFGQFAKLKRQLASLFGVFISFLLKINVSRIVDNFLIQKSYQIKSQ
jgi:hypothetical protein